MNQYLRVSEVAAIFGKHRWTIWNWVRNGKLTVALYVGDEALFDRAYIEEKAKNLNKQEVVV